MTDQTEITPAPVKYALTARQSQVLAYLRARRLETDIGASVEDISQALGLKSKGRVWLLLKALEERGRIKRIPRVARSIVLIGGDDA